MTNWTRDFIGYGSQPPRVRWPNDAKVALSLVVNFEEGAELSIADGDERNESVYEAVELVRDAIDPCMMSHYEYGLRAGFWRLMDTLHAAGVVATISACGRAVERTPLLIKEAFARGHEISCHGYRWESHSTMSEDVERRAIQRTVAAIEAVIGRAPVGWHTRSASSAQTRRLLCEHGGFLYDSDAYNDDLPYLLAGTHPHVVIPYAFDTNDMRFQPGGGFVHAEDFAHYCIAAFDRLWQEGSRGQPKMMSVGLHLRLIGRPARISGLEDFLSHVSKKGGAWICRRADIARHWLEFAGQQTSAGATARKPMGSAT